MKQYGEALIVGLETVDKTVLDKFDGIKVVGCNCTGTDHIDKKELNKRGIKLISLTGQTEFLKDITSTAEHTMGLMIAISRHYKKALVEPDFDREANLGHTLKDKKLGIIGLGRIGKQVSDLADAFKMEVWAVENPDHYHTIFNCDIITVHIPLDGNEEILDEAFFESLLPHSIFINTSRDGVVARGALLEALQKKWIAGAAIDFTDDADLVAYAKDNDNLIITNHIGGSTFEDRRATENFIKQKVKNYLNV